MLYSQPPYVHMKTDIDIDEENQKERERERDIERVNEKARATAARTHDSVKDLTRLVASTDRRTNSDNTQICNAGHSFSAPKNAHYENCLNEKCVCVCYALDSPRVSLHLSLICCHASVAISPFENPPTQTPSCCGVFALVAPSLISYVVVALDLLQQRLLLRAVAPVAAEAAEAPAPETILQRPLLRAVAAVAAVVPETILFCFIWGFVCSFYCFMIRFVMYVFVLKNIVFITLLGAFSTALWDVNL